MNPPASELMDRLRAARGNRCESCEKVFRRDRRGRPNLEFAHVRPTRLSGMGRGSRDRYYDVRRNPDAYLLLCRGCHKRLDRVWAGGRPYALAAGAARSEREAVA